MELNSTKLTKLKLFYHFGVQTSSARGSVHVYTDHTSAGVDQRVQSIHAGP